MNQGGISDKLMDFCDKLVGHLTGGMAYANIMASMILQESRARPCLIPWRWAALRSP